MMRYLLLLLCLSLSLTSYAQGETGWLITESCLGELPYPMIPHANWDFEGVIFSYNHQGVRAIRADVETSYFIAFEDEHNFPAVGNFSPDGRWFAYPTGHRDDNVNSGGDSTFLIEGISIASTDPRNIHNSYAFTDERWEFFFGSSTFTLNRYSASLYRLIWLDNERVIYLGTGDYEPIILNINTREYSLNSGVDEQLSQETDAFFNGVWLPDGSSIRVEYREYPAILRYFNPLGELEEIIIQVEYMGRLALSPDSQKLAFFTDNKLHLADLTNRSIENLCLEVPFSGQFALPEIIWSPDGSHLAFLYDGYPVLLNLESREMQILRYQTGSLMGWYPLPES